MDTKEMRQILGLTHDDHTRQHDRERLIGVPTPHIEGCLDCEPDACGDCLSVAYNEKGIIHFFDCPKHGDNPPHVTFSGHEHA